jgi:rhodanese-related sulfurtransferase
MKKMFILSAGFFAAAGLFAMGILPDKTQSNPVSGNRLEPAPVTGNSLSQTPQLPPVAPQPAVGDPDNYVPPDWAKDWDHIKFDKAVELSRNKKVIFLDARSKEEYEEGHIPGALPMPVRDFDIYFEMFKTRLDKAEKIVTYCHGISCQLSNKIASRLVKEKGYKNVGSFFGGWPKWQQHNMPVEKGMPKDMPKTTLKNAPSK